MMYVFQLTIVQTPNELQLVDKHIVLASGKDERAVGPRRRMGRQGGTGDWDRFH